MFLATNHTPAPQLLLERSFDFKKRSLPPETQPLTSKKPALGFAVRFVE
jgi:hypothetical protein